MPQKRKHELEGQEYREAEFHSAFGFAFNWWFETCFPTVILPLKTDKSNFVLIFNLQKRRFLCMDSKGQLYHSVSINKLQPKEACGGKPCQHTWLCVPFSTRQKLKNGEDCLFQRIWLDLATPYQVFYSVSGGELLKQERGKLRVIRQHQPETLSALWERFLVKRRRRRHEVNPSDPLRSQPDPPHSAKEPTDSDPRLPEQDQAGPISKETISSCDDPLQVLQSNGPVSPIKTNIADRPDQDWDTGLIVDRWRRMSSCTFRPQTASIGEQPNEPSRTILRKFGNIWHH